MTEEKPDINSQFVREREVEFRFDPRIPGHVIKKVLTALADYYRACGGAGFDLSFSYERPKKRGAE